MSVWYLNTGDKPRAVPNGKGNSVLVPVGSVVEVHRMTQDVQRLVQARLLRRVAAPKVKPVIPDAPIEVAKAAPTTFSSSITELGVVKNAADLAKLAAPEDEAGESADEDESRKKRRRRRSESTDE